MHHVLGIRHHGPGSARSVLAALQQLQPDCILVEGPPDANALITQIDHPEVIPPVALLVNTPVQKEQRSQALFFPFAEFSPEWQALQYALKHQIHHEFMDLSCSHRFALQQQYAEQAHSTEDNHLDNRDDNNEEEFDLAKQQWQRERMDPIALLAQQAGYQDSERFWEHLVEQQPHAGEMFQAISMAMGNLREAIDQHVDPQDHDYQLEQYREAAMRKTIRQAVKQGFQSIVVICGAWHAPLLADLKSTLKSDHALLKSLPKTKVESAWIAWTHGRLNRSSGYGAGVNAVGWYAHLWKYYQQLEQQIDSQTISIDWLSQFAHALRQHGHDASSAQLIDAIKLIDGLLLLRGRRIPDLDDLFDVIQTVLHHGQTLPEPVLEQLLEGEKLGQLPEHYVELPLQQDFIKQCKSFRLKLEAAHRSIELDLRENYDLAKSQFLHRVDLLGLSWARNVSPSSSRGNYKEAWRLSWQPENSLYLNEMSLWGYTVVDACHHYVQHRINQAQNLAVVADAIEEILLAGLDRLMPLALQRLQILSSQQYDPELLLSTLTPLVNALRYGSVRQFSEHELQQIIRSLCIRLMLALPQYCLSINDDFAQQTSQSLAKLYSILRILDQDELNQLWQQMLEKMLQQRLMNGYLHGYVTRLAQQQQLLDAPTLQDTLSFALSSGQSVQYSAAWFEGFIHEQALLLLHEQQLWQLVNTWLVQLDETQFIEILPILRRATSGFSPHESSKLAEKASMQTVAQHQVSSSFNLERGIAVLDALKQLLNPQVPHAN